MCAPLLSIAVALLRQTGRRMRVWVHRRVTFAKHAIWPYFSLAVSRAPPDAKRVIFRQAQLSRVMGTRSGGWHTRDEDTQFIVGRANAAQPCAPLQMCPCP